MKKLVSLAVLAFFVTIPQCLGQDACQSPAQLLEEQPLVQMSLLLMAPTTSVAVPVMAPGCIKCCGDERKAAIDDCLERSANTQADRKGCRDRARVSYRSCSDGCHHEGSCDFTPIVCQGGGIPPCD